jgi:hypothetical protein
MATISSIAIAISRALPASIVKVLSSKGSFEVGLLKRNEHDFHDDHKKNRKDKGSKRDLATGNTRQDCDHSQGDRAPTDTERASDLH